MLRCPKCKYMFLCCTKICPACGTELEVVERRDKDETGQPLRNSEKSRPSKRR